MAQAGNGPLHGLRVIDFGGSIAAAYTAVLFSAAGADVVRVEPPVTGDPIRHLPPFAPGATAPEASALQTFLDAGKRSIALDTGTGSGLSVARRLCAGADIVIEGRAPGFLEALELGAPPAQVVVSLSWFGRTGPGRELSGSDAAIQARTGFVYPIGPAEGPPIVPGGYHAQVTAGITAFVPAMAMLLARAGGGPGCVIDQSVFEANMAFTEQASVRQAAQGYELRRIGTNRYLPVYPQTIYPAADGHIGVTTLTPPQWKSFCGLLGLDALGADPAFRSAYDRCAMADRVDALLLPELKKHKVMDLFLEGQARRIPLAPVPRMEELAGLDHFRARSVFARYVHDGGFAFDAPAVPWKLAATPVRAGGTAPRLGAQGAGILHDAGLSRAEIAALAASGALSLPEVAA